MPHRPGHFGAGFSAPRKAPTREEIEKTYDQALDRFIRQNQDKKQQQSSVKSVIADMPQKFQDFIDRWDAAHLSQLQANWDNDNAVDNEGNPESAEDKIARLGARPTSYSS